MVYAAYIVRRTQIYLDQHQLVRLRSAARAAHRTVSQIIREAIDEKFERPDPAEEFDSALRRASGLWADRSDLGPTDELVRKLRQDRRGRPRR